MTGLTEEDILNYGIDEEIAIKEFFEFIENYPLIGHNILNFDVPFIEAREILNLKIDFLIL